MRWITIYAASLCLAAAACGPSGEAPKPEAPTTFPRPTASYSALYKLYDDAGGAREMTILADAGRTRVEGVMPGTGISTATIIDPASKQLITFRTGANAPKVAMTLSPDKLGAAGELFASDQARPNATLAGEDTVAGEHCRLWKIPPAVEGGVASILCTTDDGILLRNATEGDPAKTVMEAVAVKRGPQDSALFTPPAGYEIVDYGPCLTLTQEAMAAMREGKRPDMAKMQECQTLGEKLGGMFGGP